MTPAVRSQLIRLRADLASVEAGRELLDRKREAIMRALADRTPKCDTLRREAAARLDAARAALAAARHELGGAGVDAATLAQPATLHIEIGQTSVVGVRVPRIEAASGRFVPVYGPGGVSEQLDRAGALFAQAVGPVAALAAEDAAVRRLRAAFARTARRLNALDRVILPQLRGEIRALAAALEEEERDDAVRRKTWVAKFA